MYLEMALAWFLDRISTSLNAAIYASNTFSSAVGMFNSILWELIVDGEIIKQYFTVRVFGNA